MKNNVFISFEDEEHNRCVDIFERPDRTFGFEEFRRDVEDQGRWQTMAKYSELLFTTENNALIAAGANVSWLAHSELFRSRVEFTKDTTDQPDPTFEAPHPNPGPL